MTVSAGETKDPMGTAHFGNIPPFALLRAFETIGRLGSIRKAALALGLDHAGVSRRLKELESWAGAPLMLRARGASGALTPDGIRCHERISMALLEIERAGNELLQSAEDVLLDVRCSHGFARKWLVPRLDRFAGLHAKLELSVRATDTPPDLTSPECVIDIRYVGDWMALPARSKVETATLYRPRAVPVASPSFLRAMRPVTAPDELLQRPLLLAEDLSSWRAWLALQGARGGTEIRGVSHCNSLSTIEAAKLGRGIALSNHLLVADELRSGELVEVAMDRRPFMPLCIGSYRLQAREEFWQRDGVRSFRQWLRAALQHDSLNSSIR